MTFDSMLPRLARGASCGTCDLHVSSFRRTVKSSKDAAAVYLTVRTGMSKICSRLAPGERSSKQILLSFTPDESFRQCGHNSKLIQSQTFKVLPRGDSRQLFGCDALLCRLL